MSASGVLRSKRARRAALFLGLFLLVPLPMAVFGGHVPAARVCELAILCILVAVREGAAGPVKMMTFLFTAQALAYSVLWWLVACVLERWIRPPRGRVLALALLVVGAAALIAALCFDVYATPFAPAPRGNLWEALT